MTAAFDDATVAAVVVLGPAGVGKSRFAEECRVAAEQRGRSTYRVIGTLTASTVPLGALAHLAPRDLQLPDPRASGPLEIVDIVRAAISGFVEGSRSGGRPLVVVDDAHLLDPLSLVVIGQLVASGTTFVVATARSTEELPDGVTALWRSGGAMRLDLGELSREQVDALLHIALGGPVEGATALACWTYSEGNVLALHELVLDALDRGVLVSEGGLWKLTGPLLGTGQATGVVQARLGALDEESRRVLELLSVAEELGLPDLEARFSMTCLEHLEQQGIITVTPDGRRTTLRIGHPLYADAVRAGLAFLRLRRLRSEVIDLLEQHGARRRTDQVRIVSLRVDNREPADPEVMLRAAVLARHVNDHTTVERLARLAYHAQPSPLAGRLLGEALFELGHFDESLAVLEEASTLAETADERYDLAFAKTHTLFLGLGRAGAAIAAIDDLAKDPDLAGRRPEIAARRAGLLVWMGEIDRAAEGLDLDSTGADRALAIELAHARQTIDLLSGRTLDALRAAEATYKDQIRQRDLMAWVPPLMHRLTSVWAMIELARFEEARLLLGGLYAEATAPGLAGPRHWFTIELGRLELCVGNLLTAERWFREAATSADEPAQPRAARLALAGLAMAAGQRGDQLVAAEAIERLDAVGGDDVELADTEWDRGRAWALVAAGRVTGALTLLAASAERARSTGRLLFEHRLLHTTLRLGAAHAVVDRLTDLATMLDTPLAAVAARHAAGLVAGDADLLEASCDDYAALGYLLFAAETAGQAAEAARRQGTPRRATALIQRSKELAHLCESPATPPLLHSESITPLTAREREVALLLAKGTSNKEISARLFLSVRTVENHVQSILMKLGVARRSDVAAALGLGSDLRSEP